MTAHRCVIVTGFPRSGTSWLAKGLSFAPGFTYYREPDNYDRVARGGGALRLALPDGGRGRSRLSRSHDPRLRRAGSPPRSPCGRIRVPSCGRSARRDAGWASGSRRSSAGSRASCSSSSSPISTSSGSAARFPHARQLCVLRHPCGQFESWRRLGWEPRPDRLLENPRLVADHLHPFADLLRRAQGFWERAGALWGATMYVIHRQTSARVPPRDRGLRMALRGSGGAVPGALPPAGPGMERRGRALPEPRQSRRRPGGRTRCSGWRPSR